MVTAAGDGNHTREDRNLHGYRAQDSLRAVAELTEAVGSPRPEGTVALEGDGMPCPSGYGGHIRQAKNLDGHIGSGEVPISELAIFVVAPRPNGAVTL